MSAYDTIAEALVVASTVRAASGDIPVLDTIGLEQVVCYLTTGNPGGAATIDLVLEESSDDGDTDPYTAIPGAAFSQKTNAIGNGTTHVGWLTLNVPLRKRYIRASSTVTGGYFYSVLFAASGLQTIPVDHPNGIEWVVDQTIDT